MATLSIELQNRLVTGVLLAFLALILIINDHPLIISSAIIFILITILTIEWPSFNHLWLTPFYPVAPFILLLLLNHSPERMLLPLIVVSALSFDAGAYCTGKLHGRTKLCPTISPKKTWEGFAGGALTSLFVTQTFLAYYHHPISLPSLIVFCLAVSATATIGYLFESKLKRRARLKDAGDTLPGHGGWLDRIDSVLGTVIFFFPFRGLIITLLNW